MCGVFLIANGGKTKKATAGPSISLRFAQDDNHFLLIFLPWGKKEIGRLPRVERPPEKGHIQETNSGDIHSVSVCDCRVLSRWGEARVHRCVETGIRLCAVV
jgi:hypothetical protein